MTMNFVTFNQDYSYLAVGTYEPSLNARFLTGSLLNILPATSKGFRIFTTDPFSKSYETKEGHISIIEMLFSTSLVALILSPRRLQITNTKVRVGCYKAPSISSHCMLTEFRSPAQRQSTICELTFPTTVLAVRLNRKRLVILLEDQIYLYDIQTMKLLYTIETSPNPTGKA